MKLNTWPHLLSGTALAITAALACAGVAYADDPGDLDITFNGTGIVTTTVDTGGEGAESVAIQPDGKIVVVGEGYRSPKYNFVVIRYRGDGNLDGSFGHGGIVTTAISSGFDGAHAVAIQPDDSKIVAAGMSGRDGAAGSDLAAVRYQSDGSLDPTFNSTGIVTTSVGSSDSAGLAVAIQHDDNSIVVAGGCGHVSDCRDFAVVRYTSSGSLDPSFNHTGIVTTSIGAYADAAAVALQPDGKIVVAGSGDSTLAVARYTITGSLDTSFNGTGIVTTSIGDWTAAYGVAIQPNGKIVAVGSSADGSNRYFTVVRYKDDGTLDADFNHTGVVTASFSGGATSVALQADSKIVVASGTSGGFAVVRFNGDGSLDANFNHTGVVTTTIPGAPLSAALSVAIQPSDGKIVASGIGAAAVNEQYSFVVVRYLGQDSHSYFYHFPVILKRGR